jgi:acylphosphatase
MSDPLPDVKVSRLRATVHGRVQGVAFRHHTQRRAAALGLGGHVQNLWDGNVEVVAEGRRPALEELLLFLRVGPRGALVTQVDVEWSPPTGVFVQFEVRF